MTKLIITNIVLISCVFSYRLCLVGEPFLRLALELPVCNFIKKKGKLIFFNAI